MESVFGQALCSWPLGFILSIPDEWQCLTTPTLANFYMFAMEICEDYASLVSTLKSIQNNFFFLISWMFDKTRWPCSQQLDDRQHSAPQRDELFFNRFFIISIYIYTTVKYNIYKVIHLNVYWKVLTFWKYDFHIVWRFWKTTFLYKK